MARARNIKPSIMDNDQLAELAPLSRLLFVYLWMLADREGRLEDRPKRIAAQALPFDRDADAGAMLDDLAAAGFLIRYRVDGVALIQITNFAKHQNPHPREAPSLLPPHQGNTKATPRQDQGNAKDMPSRADSLIPDVLIPDSLISDSGQREVAPDPPPPREEPETRSPKGSRLSLQSMPDEYRDFCRQERPDLSPSATWDRFRDHWTAKPGKDGVKLDWLATWRNWVRGERAMPQPRASPSPSRHSAVIADLTGRQPRPPQPQPDTIDVEPRTIAERLG